MAARIVRIAAALVLVAPVFYFLVARPDAAPVPGKTVVRYMAWGYPSHLATEKELIALFESMPENSDVDVELIMAPMQSYFDKLQLMLVSDTAPDLFRINPTYLWSFVERDFLMQLDPIMEADPEWDPAQFFEMARIQGRYADGKHYALVVIFGTNLIYYNKTMFREAGVEDPWEMFLDDRWTWEAFRQTAIKLTKFDEEGRPLRYGTNFGPSVGGRGAVSAVSFATAGFGGRLISEDLKKSLVNSPEVVKAVEWVRDLVWKDRAAPTPANTAMAVFNFESGKIAMEFDASGESRRMREAITKFDWDVVPLPLGVDGRSAGYGGHLLVMNSRTKSAEAAWRFMKFLVSPDAERLLACKLRRCIPTRRDVAFSDEYLTADGPPYNTRAFIAQIDLPPPPYVYDAKYSEWVVEFTNALDRIFLGNEAPQPVLDEAAARIDIILAREEN